MGDRNIDSRYFGRSENMTVYRPVTVADGVDMKATEVSTQHAAGLVRITRYMSAAYSKHFFFVV